MNPEMVLENCITAHPELSRCKIDIQAAYQKIRGCYEHGGKLLLCGNGGSASDADHIAGELVKGFYKKRPAPEELRRKIIAIDPGRGTLIAEKIQMGLSAMSLMAAPALISAVINDTDPALMYAQQVSAHGREGDVLLGISTSGNAENVIHAMILARAIGMVTIGLSGESGGNMKDVCDIIIRVPAHTPASAQELHLPVYHALCEMIETTFFDK